MRATPSGNEWVRKRESMWVDALVSLYGLLKVRQCYAFYVVYRERSILFCAPGVGGVTDGGYAVVTNSNAKIRAALKDAAVDFTSADEEAPGDRQSENCVGAEMATRGRGARVVGQPGRRRREPSGNHGAFGQDG